MAEEKQEQTLISPLTVSGPVSYVILQKKPEYKYPFPNNILILGDIHMYSEFKADVPVTEIYKLFPKDVLYIVEEFRSKRIVKIGEVKAGLHVRRTEPYLLDREKKIQEKYEGEIMIFSKRMGQDRTVISIDNRPDIAYFTYICNSLHHVDANTTIDYDTQAIYSALSRSYGYYHQLIEDGSLFRRYDKLFSYVKKCPGKINSVIFRTLLQVKKEEYKHRKEIKRFLDGRSEHYRLIYKFEHDSRNIEDLSLPKRLITRSESGSPDKIKLNLFLDKYKNRYLYIKDGNLMEKRTTRFPKKVFGGGFSVDTVIIRWGKTLLLYSPSESSITLAQKKEVFILKSKCTNRVVVSKDALIIQLRPNDKKYAYYVIDKSGMISRVKSPPSINCDRIVDMYVSVMDMAILATLCAYMGKTNSIVMYIGGKHLDNITDLLVEQTGIYNLVSQQFPKGNNPENFYVTFSPRALGILINNFGMIDNRRRTLAEVKADILSFRDYLKGVNVRYFSSSALDTFYNRVEQFADDALLFLSMDPDQIRKVYPNLCRLIRKIVENVYRKTWKKFLSPKQTKYKHVFIKLERVLEKTDEIIPAEDVFII